MIFKSATKLVLLFTVFVLGLITLYAVGLGVWRGTLDVEKILVLFGYVVTGVTSFYFGKNANDTPVTPTV